MLGDEVTKYERSGETEQVLAEESYISVCMHMIILRKKAKT